MEDADLASFHYSLINITGFQMFDRMEKKFLQNRKMFEDIYREQITTVDYLPVVLTSDDGTLTGRIEFDPNTGWRTNFSAAVIEIKPGVNSLNSIKERFQWAQGKGFLLDQQRMFHENKPNVTMSAKGILVDKPWKLSLNVVTVLGDPLQKGNDRFEGYCIDLLKLLAKNISGFEYNIFVSEGNKYGARQPDGSWDGMLGYLLNETADIAVAPLTITQERERAVDFSKPFMTTEKMTPPIESVEDLANQNKILYGVVKGGSTAAFFEDSTVPLYKKMWDFMQDEHNKFLRNQAPESVFVDTYAEGIDRGKYAFLLEETTNNYEGGRKPCNTMKDSGASSSLNLSKVAGIFYILMCGMVLSMLTALVEFLVRKKKENRQKEKKRQSVIRQRPFVTGASNRFNKRRTKSEEARGSLSTQC
ncbi:hypothetical protein NECAME_08901 [Necator americanus]|uniref:Ligand-gated ion channel n=1 Tax=Necator americanus TaxID=51031 RepID=W2TGW7_NECAM|nr:hypothetical protein NECAME_08901 [Necator americanus]ETN80824.1 hypothetical protein NECAME_08901 [Necator americanus]